MLESEAAQSKNERAQLTTQLQQLSNEKKAMAEQLRAAQSDGQDRVDKVVEEKRAVEKLMNVSLAK
jgi:outer membrane murein-binding lipoprotein Lpp